MKVLITGVPNSGKSQFRRWLVKKLRDAGLKAGHWDADQFKTARCPEDKDMRKPTDDPGIICLVEDVRGTLPFKKKVNPGEKGGAWRPLSYYNIILYLRPDWPTYALFWVSRALQWKREGKGDYKREDGWKDLSVEEVLVRKIQHYLDGMEAWVKEDGKVIRRMPQIIIKPVYVNGQIEWQFDPRLIEAITGQHDLLKSLINAR